MMQLDFCYYGTLRGHVGVRGETGHLLGKLGEDLREWLPHSASGSLGLSDMNAHKLEFA